MSQSIGKYQVYYSRILQELVEIKDNNNYQNLSKAFAHWYLSNFYKINENDLGEIIIDGFGDNGIDAIIRDNDILKIFQFKFPDKVGNVNKQIEETTVLKIVNGYKKLTSNRKNLKVNENFNNYRNIIKEENIFHYEFVFVSFTDGLSINAKESLDTSISEIKELTGNKIEYVIDDKKKICDKVDRAQKNNIINVELKYGNLLPSYNVEDNIKSWVGFCSAKDILNSVKDSLDIIFDENIRNYEGDNSVNNGIYKTSTNTEESKYFYFYHNGIVFICDECKNSVGNQTAKLQSSAIVNGCQTIVSLKKSMDDGLLQDNVYVPIRIIETIDIDLRAKITEYLNTQNKIRDSYFLANNTFIRELQVELLKSGYYLERLANEYSYKLSLNKVSEYPKEKILQLEKVIQIYVAFYNNEYAAISKRGKNELFNKDLINELIYGISSKKVLESQDKYNKICKIITMYRRCRRVERNDEFLNYINVYPKSDDEYMDNMDKYQFMNTADLLLLNGFSNINLELDFDEKLKYVIDICKKVINKEKKLSPSSATKTSYIFEEVQSKCKNLKEEKSEEIVV